MQRAAREQQQPRGGRERERGERAESAEGASCRCGVRLGVLEVAERSDLVDVVAAVLDRALRAVADQVLEHIQRLVHDAPVLARLVDALPHILHHDGVLLVVVGGLRDLGEHRAARAPRLVAARLGDLLFQLGSGHLGPADQRSRTGGRRRRQCVGARAATSPVALELRGARARGAAPPPGRPSHDARRTRLPPRPAVASAHGLLGHPLGDVHGCDDLRLRVDVSEAAQRTGCVPWVSDWVASRRGGGGTVSAGAGGDGCRWQAWLLSCGECCFPRAGLDRR